MAHIVHARCRHCGTRVKTFGDICADCTPEVEQEAITREEVRRFFAGEPEQY